MAVAKKKQVSARTLQPIRKYVRKTQAPMGAAAMIAKAIKETEAELGRLQTAYAILVSGGKVTPTGRTLSPAAKKRISDRMKQLWADRKNKQGKGAQ